MLNWLEIIRYAADSTLKSVMGMKPSFLIKRSATESLNTSMERRNTPNITKQRIVGATKELVKPRPPGLEERYALCDSNQKVEDSFRRLRELLFEVSDALSSKARNREGGTIVTKEIGKTNEGRPFLYFKPFSDFGWLVEKTGPGWRISRAEKIVSDQIFLRGQGDPWDQVLLYEDPLGVGSLRIKSQRFGKELMTASVYEERMKSAFESELMGQVARH
jgi:hypothetical protein